MSLTSLFYPKSVAVIGASIHKGSVGYEIAKNLAKQGYRGRLYFVNTKRGRLFGHRLISDLGEIKSTLDLAIIAIPAAAVIEEIRRLIPLKVRAVVVISAGFKETGNKKLEEELAKVCEDNQITLVGPNCLGIINPQVKLNASFAPLMPTSGSVAFVSQSGAICASVLDYARERSLGFSKFVSVGNKACVGEAELLDYLYKDTSTRVIAMYMEEVEAIKILREAAIRVSRGKPHKPIIVLKAGRSEEGRKAALSHTGSLGSSDEAYEALFDQTGIIRAQTIEELFDFAECFARNRAFKNNRVAIITNAGGPGVVSADAIAASGLKLAKFSPETTQKLRSLLPAAAGINNPVDILGDAPAERYAQTLKLIFNDPGVGAVQIILTPQSMTQVEETARVIVYLAKQSKKPLVATFMGQGLVEEGVDILNRSKIATSYFPESASRALSALYLFARWLMPRSMKPRHFSGVKKDIVRKIFAHCEARGEKLLTASESLDVLEAYGFPVGKRWVIASRESASDLSRKIDGPLALKILSPDISHKSDIGGVVLGVEVGNLAGEYARLVDHIKKVKPLAKILGVEVMPMVAGDGVEIIIGVTTDKTLGKQILVGLGGIYTEVLRDISWGLAPLTTSDIHRMIGNLKTARILAGIRGHEPFDVDEIVECLGRVSQLVCDFPNISQVDINPLKVFTEPKGATVLDARIVLL